MPPARHAVIVDAYPHLFYGAQRTAALLALSLPAAGWTAEVVTTGPGPFVEHLRAAGVAVTVLRVPGPLARYGGPGARPALGAAGAHLPVWRQLARHLTGRADVVHADDHRGMLLAGPAARLAGVPVVWHLHYVQRAPALTAVCRALASRIVACSVATARDTPGVDPARVTVVPNALDPRFATAPPAGPRADPPFIVTAGRLHPDKGLDVAIDALALARREVPDLRLVVLGDATPGWEHYPAELRRRAAARGVGDAVELAGYTARPELRWAGAGAYVQASRHEPFGIAVAEAMAVGLPVVVSDAGGLPELVLGGRLGLVVPAGDAAALAAAVVRLVTDTALAERLATAARAHALATWTPERLAAAVATVYEGLLR